MTDAHLRSLPNADNITRTTLDNGITILVYENHHAQSVVVAGSLPAGSLFETPAENGLASLVANSLIRGTQTRDFDAIHSQLEDIGADLGFGSGHHKTRFSGKALAEDFSVLIELLADTLRQPAFPTEQVERLRGEWLTGLRYRQNDPGWLANRDFRRHLYPEHYPYHYGTQGTLETIPTLTIDAMRDFHRLHYGPEGMILVVVGAVNSAPAIDIIARHLGDWHNADQHPAPTLPELQLITQTHRSHISLPGKSQSELVMGVRGPSRFAPDYRAATIANSILGQFGMMGRIGDVVREREGLAYYAGSQLTGGYGPAPWIIRAGVNPANVERTIALCIEEIQRIISEPVSEEDLEDNKSYFVGHLPLQMENNDGIAGALLTIKSYNLGLNYLLDYYRTIVALNSNDILEAARHYLTPDTLVISVAGPDEHTS